ncbi:hypothetical protein SAMD00019534_025040 [Acytostelium subglobosum LB1]|uniref:hypothetical protein n=1 Tax=Acytostelium subglobosum LB1 TaxID=1410327 RepID=UPI000644A2C5|nr:hypothetical protein SAMD00019534_025040 [Acytostelium subglobosum LB1]GAM19329.1 hypothetical protein SAMD00019534_025040 [Acytostelium subglobosum LB1]|eukprot:XP_012757256.1 hypothetical protein SAMD00019534_025040 [Acytostelium subglobosum LB1]
MNGTHTSSKSTRLPKSTKPYPFQVYALGYEDGVLVNGHLRGELINTISDSMREGNDRSVTFRTNDDAKYLAPGYMRVCVITDTDCWLRKAKVECAWVSQTNNLTYEIIAGDKAGYEYKLAAHGNVKWNFQDIKIEDGSMQITFYRDDYGWTELNTLIISEAYIDAFKDQCLMVYWDNHQLSKFSSYSSSYPFNTMFDAYLAETADNAKDNTLPKPSGYGEPLNALRKKRQVVDKDGDGKPDKTATGKPATKPKDTDKDGIPDSKDKDKDGDGKIDKPATAKPKASARA